MKEKTRAWLLKEKREIEKQLESTMDKIPENIGALEDIRNKLLEEAKMKSIKMLMQYDLHLNFQDDDCIHPDKDGDIVTWGHVKELRNTECIRLQFPIDANPFDVIRALDKIKGVIKHNMVRAFKKVEINNRLEHKELPF